MLQRLVRTRWLPFRRAHLLLPLPVVALAEVGSRRPHEPSALVRGILRKELLENDRLILVLVKQLEELSRFGHRRELPPRQAETSHPVLELLGADASTAVEIHEGKSLPRRACELDNLPPADCSSELVQLCQLVFVEGMLGLPEALQVLKRLVPIRVLHLVLIVGRRQHRRFQRVLGRILRWRLRRRPRRRGRRRRRRSTSSAILQAEEGKVLVVKVLVVKVHIDEVVGHLRDLSRQLHWRCSLQLRNGHLAWRLPARHSPGLAELRGGFNRQFRFFGPDAAACRGPAARGATRGRRLFGAGLQRLELIAQPLDLLGHLCGPLLVVPLQLPLSVRLLRGPLLYQGRIRDASLQPVHHALLDELLGLQQRQLGLHLVHLRGDNRGQLIFPPSGRLGGRRGRCRHTWNH
mmetsp:Transcript_36357/g.94022  ORF Transcript_36357/g.94022 Transcript_36357/m.94022 type:complete len:407 (-) Transcript_36357:179-1399(-)